MTTIVLLLCHLLPFSQSAPEPDTHLHVHLPPEGGQGGNPNTGGGLAAKGFKTGMGRQGNRARFNDYSANLLSASMRRNGQRLQSRSYDYADGLSRGEGEGWIDASLRWDPNNKWLCGKSLISIDPDEIIGGRLAEPNAFPWMVRITDGSCGLCGGTLITSKHVLTAYHCVYSSEKNKLCTGQIIIMGRNNLKDSDIFEDPDCKIKKKKKECKYKKNIRTMEIKKAIYPPNAGFSKKTNDVSDHDFAMYILKDPVVFSATVSPICLPHQDERHNGQRVVAAGWGRFETKNTDNPYTERQSDLLKRVNLVVSNVTYKHTKMFGTKLEFKRGEYQDPCSGDSGGPLMHQTPNSDSSRWVIIGTVRGGGYNCKDGEVNELEGHDDGIWNKVSAHTEWILENIAQDKDGGGGGSEDILDPLEPATGTVGGNIPGSDRPGIANDAQTGQYPTGGGADYAGTYFL